MLACIAAVGLLMSACGGDDAEEDTATDTTTEETGEETDATATGEEEAATDAGAAGEDIELGVGVTEEACPDGGNPDNGCIYLGIISDLTVGPFAPLAQTFTQGQQDFWRHVNEQGGIAGFDVDASEYVEDSEYNPERHAQSYQRIEPEVLALAHSLGTPPTLAIIDQLRNNNVFAVPATWWSGWEFEDIILNSGPSYCVDAMNAVDWAVEEHGVESMVAVGYPGDYGGDGTAGATRAAEANGLEVVDAIQQTPIAAGGDVSGTVDAILQAQPDLVMLIVGPQETGQIVGRAVAQGFEGRFIGSGPSYSAALLESDAADAILEHYNGVGPFGIWGADSEAHQTMMEVFEGETPENDGYTWGWIQSYPLRALIEQAASNGTLTRDGMREALDGLTVSYDGAASDKTFGQDPDEMAQRESFILEPSREAPLGIQAIRDLYVGPTAQEVDLSEPCSQAG